MGWVGWPIWRGRLAADNSRLDRRDERVGKTLTSTSAGKSFMADKEPEPVASLSGGLAASGKTFRKWRWGPRGARVSEPVRCRRETWYLVRGSLRDGCATRRTIVTVQFLDGDEPLRACTVELASPTGAEPAAGLLGWVQSPERASHLRLRIDRGTGVDRLEQLLMRPVAERDPKCHPYANVPRWSRYRPPFEISRVVLPRSLEALAGRLHGLETVWVDVPASLDALRRRARWAACIVDPAWVTSLALDLARLETLAQQSWVIVDLPTLANLVRRSGAAKARAVERHSEDGIMSARVEYADVPTRGLALQDVAPYGTFDAHGGFGLRALRAGRSWRKFADARGLATLLASETPSEKESGDVLSAMRALGTGELLATDLPWLVAGELGQPVAPHLAEHLLRMHLGLPLDDAVQYWNRWQDGEVTVRDIGDMPRRYRRLFAVRWASRRPGLAHLGLSLDAPGAAARRRLVLRTGRIDSLEPHDGVPPEPMMILMRWLAREAAEQTPWARRHLADTSVTWQFDTADGLRYSTHFDSAARLRDVPAKVVRLRMPGFADEKAGHGAGRPAGSDEIVLPPVAGVHGDGSLDFQYALTGCVRRLLKA